MKIEWDKVTWYSKTLAVLLFVFFICGAFWFGSWYQNQFKELSVKPIQTLHESTPLKPEESNGKLTIQDSDIRDASLSWKNMPKNFLYSNTFIEKTLQHCLSGPESTTLSMNACAETAMKKYDALLDTVYQVIGQDIADSLQNVDGPDSTSDMGTKALVDEKNNLNKSKNLFTQYRVATCTAAYDEALGGTLGGQLYDGCYIEVTRAQIQTLCSIGANSSRCDGKISF